MKVIINDSILKKYISEETILNSIDVDDFTEFETLEVVQLHNVEEVDTNQYKYKITVKLTDIEDETFTYPLSFVSSDSILYKSIINIMENGSEDQDKAVEDVVYECFKGLAERTYA